MVMAFIWFMLKCCINITGKDFLYENTLQHNSIVYNVPCHDMIKYELHKCRATVKYIMEQNSFQIYCMHD